MKQTALTMITMVSALLLPQAALAFPVDFGPGFTTHRVNVDGDVVSVTVGGHGPAVVLIHGYAADSRMWKPLAIALALHFTVIAPDLPGIGNSAIPAGGSNMSYAARRVRDAVHALGYQRASVVGPTHSLSLADREGYVAAYSRPGRMAAGWAYFDSFPQTAVDFARLATTKLPMPVLSIGGDKATGAALGTQVRAVAESVTVVVLKNTGHWLMEENPQQTIPALTKFLESH
ncbi:MAG: alpha/beta fold hydrolase [Candidatus Cybelea sp.]